MYVSPERAAAIGFGLTGVCLDRFDNRLPETLER